MSVKAEMPTLSSAIERVSASLHESYPGEFESVLDAILYARNTVALPDKATNVPSTGVWIDYQDDDSRAWWVMLTADFDQILDVCAAQGAP